MTGHNYPDPGSYRNNPGKGRGVDPQVDSQNLRVVPPFVVSRELAYLTPAVVNPIDVEVLDVAASHLNPRRNSGALQRIFGNKVTAVLDARQILMKVFTK